MTGLSFSEAPAIPLSETFLSQIFLSKTEAQAPPTKRPPGFGEVRCAESPVFGWDVALQRCTLSNEQPLFQLTAVLGDAPASLPALGEAARPSPRLFHQATVHQATVSPLSLGP